MPLEKVKSKTTLDVELCLLEDLHVGSGGKGDSIAQLPIVREPSKKGVEAYIPGSSLKGKLRHECSRLLRGLGIDPEEIIDEIFGCEKNQSKLRFFNSDRVPLKVPEVRYHASLNPMGTAQNFYSLEAVPRGEKIRFKIQGKNIDPWQTGLLIAGLKSLADRGMGGWCSRGYGAYRLEKISVEVDGRLWEKPALLKALEEKILGESI
ncbi:MAG TPA: hypothetical protein EYP19_07935 [Desulfobacterales bacterium]|nr:hypothetical protein [Desulfobacterales bacterium]